MKHKKFLMVASVASMIDQFNLPNIQLLLAMGCEVHVACNFKEGNTCDTKRLQKLRKKLQKLHVRCHQWDCPRSVYALGKCYRAYQQLMELTQKYSFECLHCHSPIGGVLARLVAHQRNIRVIYTAHGFHFYKGAPMKNWLLYYPLEKMLSYWTDLLITVNKEDYKLARQHLCARQICHIPGIGIDIGKYQRFPTLGVNEKKKLRKKYGIPSEAVLLLSVGELSRRKNHRIVISVLPQFIGSEVYYLICGQGACEKKLLKQAERLGVKDHIRLTGFMEDVSDLYQIADIFVFPSIQEGMPVALMEAMAAGLAGAVSDIRGNRELIGRDAWGVRFVPLQTRQLQKALEKLITDEMLRDVYGARNIRKIQAYSLYAVQKRMRLIYQVMLSDRQEFSL